MVNRYCCATVTKPRKKETRSTRTEYLESKSGESGMNSVLSTCFGRGGIEWTSTVDEEGRVPTVEGGRVMTAEGGRVMTAEGGRVLTAEAEFMLTISAPYDDEGSC
jgi:hypothetical protein